MRHRYVPVDIKWLNQMAINKNWYLLKIVLFNQSFANILDMEWKLASFASNIWIWDDKINGGIEWNSESAAEEQ